MSELFCRSVLAQEMRCRDCIRMQDSPVSCADCIHWYVCEERELAYDEISYEYEGDITEKELREIFICEEHYRKCRNFECENFSDCMDEMRRGRC